MTPIEYHHRTQQQQQSQPQHYQQQQQRNKRKLDDLNTAAAADDFDPDYAAATARMRRDNNEAAPAVHTDSASTSQPNQSSPRHHSYETKVLPPRPPDFIQFFVRTFSGRNLVIYAHRNDTVECIHEKIQSITGIPAAELRLLYGRKQLHWEEKLCDCGVTKDATLQLSARLRSTGHPLAWQKMDEFVFVVRRLCRGEVMVGGKSLMCRIYEFIKMTPQSDFDQAAGHLQIFLSSCAPAALVLLYMSQHSGNREVAYNSIKHFVDSIPVSLPKSFEYLCAPILLEFCNLLRKVPGITEEEDDKSLYILCRSCLGSMAEYAGIVQGLKNVDKIKCTVTVEEICVFVREIAGRLSQNLALNLTSVGSLGPKTIDVQDFTAFLLPLRKSVSAEARLSGPIFMSKCEGGRNPPYFVEEIKLLHGIYYDLLEKMGKCLAKMEMELHLKDRPLGMWDHYLDILKELNSIAKLYHGAEEEFWALLRQRKVPLWYLIITYAKRTGDHQWILEHKDVTNFEARRHLALMLLPEVKDEYEELHEMLIDRSQLLPESFEYIARADADALRAGLFMEFKNEEATGPGVLREWFFLVCQAIFNPQNALFVACPNDRRRFFPNPASKVDPLHLEYFNFAGRIIALALIHKIQVGIVFDRVFFLQLAGENISLEDIRDADPFLYSSCKKILDMDPQTVDQDALGLTFVREFEELGSRKVVELCPDGRSILVNSKNRNEYVDRLIQHRFVTTIAEQVSHFAQGFADIVCCPTTQKLFFKSLELEDFDWMLHGSENSISVEDWRAHTEYNGYKETDPQISWFWKIVGEMTAEQKKVLLFFWTSLKYLPVEGFCGLASRLYIYKSPEPFDRLPSSHTCFYRLCFPPYPSMAVMQDRLRIVTQEHVGYSFGTW